MFQDKAYQAKQRTETKQKAWKKKKKMEYPGNRDRRAGKDNRPPATGVNAIKVTKSQKKKRRNSQGPKKNISEIICYNCIKKGNNSKDCTKPKN